MSAFLNQVLFLLYVMLTVQRKGKERENGLNVQTNRTINLIRTGNKLKNNRNKDPSDV